MKYQVSFRAKTYLHMWKDHRCYGYIKNPNSCIANSKKVAFAIGHWQLGIEHLGTRTQCNDLLEWPLNSSFPVHNSQCPKHSSLNQLYIWMKWFGISLLFTSFILLHEKFLQFDWLRAVVFQLNLKYLHVKITNLLRVAYKQIIA